MWVRSLGWEDPGEQGTTTHSSILAWKNPRAEEPGGWQSMGSQSDMTEWLSNPRTHPLKTICPITRLKTTASPCHQGDFLSPNPEPVLLGVGQGANPCPTSHIQTKTGLKDQCSLWLTPCQKGKPLQPDWLPIRLTVSLGDDSTSLLPSYHRARAANPASGCRGSHSYFGMDPSLLLSASLHQQSH